ncbi:MAG TPA: phytanoyl-CoA dioxygenase family protein [Acidimicrobiales bacterium]
MSRGRRPPAPVTLTVTDVRAATRHLTTFGYVVLPAAFDARPLADEIDRVLADAHADPDHQNRGSAGNRFRYAPMMVASTPVSLSLALQLGEVAARLLGAPVVPGRAKGTEYAGISGWHRDTELPARSIGCLTYLEPLTARGGALWVLPGSHHAGYADAIVAADRPDLPGVAVPTSPGDVIVIDERLFHCSKGSGRRRRRQWRVDYLADDPGADAALAEYFAAQHSPDWDGGYDVERYPSYGPAWRALDARWDARLDALGAYEAGRVEEEAAARRRGAPS